MAAVRKVKPVKPKSNDLEIDCVLSEYKTFELSKCMPNAWEQSNDDCWIDSVLYALFASDLRNIFSEILDSMNVSRDINIKKTAKYISNYLEILNTDSQLESKQKRCYKNLIIHSFDTYLKQIKSKYDVTYDVLKEVEIKYNNVIKGALDVILQLFQYMNQTDYTFKIDLLIGLDGTSLKDNVTDYITTDPQESILIINYMRGTLEPDNTKVKDIQKLPNYKLISYLSGIERDHTVATVSCDGSFNYYNNQAKKAKKQLVTSIDNLDLEMMNDVDQIILIYLRNDLESGAAVAAANSP
jgi:hypothetical protein